MTFKCYFYILQQPTNTMMNSSATWRHRGGRAPTLFNTSVSVKSSVTMMMTKDNTVLVENISAERRGSLQGSDRSSSCSEFACSTEMMSDVPNIGTAAIPVKESPAIMAIVPYDPKLKTVAWATPLSLHDTRVITPMTHPNRAGQFGDGRKSKITDCLFEGAAGSEAEIALMDGKDFVCWLPCTILACVGYKVYDVEIHDVEEARCNGVAGQMAEGIHSSFLQYVDFDEVNEISTITDPEMNDNMSDVSSESNNNFYSNGYDGDEDSLDVYEEEFETDSESDAS